MFNQSINEPITTDGKYQKHGLASWQFKKSTVIEDTAVSPQYTANPTSTGVTVSAIAGDGSTITLTGVISTTGLVFNAGTRIAFPNTKLFNNVNKITQSQNLVVTVSQDANGDGAGNVTIILSEPLQAAGFHANVNVLPAVSDPALVFNAHKNNYFMIPMGILANPLPLEDIFGADNAEYRRPDGKIILKANYQGVNTNGVNTFRVQTLIPTLAVAPYLIHLPSAL